MASNLTSVAARILTAAAVTCLLAGSPATPWLGAQVVGTAPNSLGGPPASPLPGHPNPLDAPVAAGIPPRMAAAGALARENERQRKLVEDSNRLLALATQLHAEVAKTDKNMLSVDVVRRAEEIEKLARSVKDRMRAQ